MKQGSFLLLVTGLLVVAAATAGAVCGEDVEQDPTTTRAASGAGHGQSDIVAEIVETAPVGETSWVQFDVQGMSVEIPNGPDWRSNLNYDGCDPLLAQYFLIEHQPSRVRFRVDFQDDEIRIAGTATPPVIVQQAIERIEGSISGTFTGDPRLGGTPAPTPLRVCDTPGPDIPELGGPVAPPAISDTPEPTMTPDPTATPVALDPPIAPAE